MMVYEKETTSNLFGFYCDLEETGQITSDKIEGIPFIDNKQGEWPAYILGGNYPDEGKMQKIASAMEQGKCPAFWIRKTEGDKGFDSLAGKYGIRQVNMWQGMELFLNHPLVSETCGQFPKPKLITSSGELHEWTELINTEVLSGKKIDHEIFSRLIRSEKYKFFKLMINGEMVSTLLAYLQPDTAGIYMVATRKEMRGRGYGSHITCGVLNLLFNSGFRKFVLHATKAGYPLYKKIGFSENIQYGIFWKVGKL